jgi:DNA repair exonuclease SbcCD ATPase subunit
MKKIVFNNLKIKNFLSVGEKEIIINFQSGINLITGENKDKDSRNGVGKSSIIESIYWSLFGNTLRDIKKDKIIHNHSKKNCSVELNFTITQYNQTKQYKLIRSLEPNKVSLQEDGDDISMSTMPKTDAYIKKLIGANEEVFQNAVIMSANNTQPFMAQKRVDKRKFIEGVLQLNIFGEMLLQARSDFNEAKNENTKLSSVFLEQQKNIEIYTNQINKNKIIKEEKLKNIQAKIKNTKNKIKEISSLNFEALEKELIKTREELDKKEQDLDYLESKAIPKINESIKNQQQTIQTIQNTIQHLNQAKIQMLKKEGECPTCKRPFEDYNKEENKTQLQNIESESNKQEGFLKIESEKNKNLSDKLSELNILQKKLKEKIEQLREQKEKLFIDSKLLEQLNNTLRDLQKEYEELRLEKDSIEDLLNVIQIKTKETEQNLEKIQKQMTILENVKFVVSEEGVKTFIIKKMIDLLNQRLNHYLQVLEAPCRCYFNENFEEYIINDSGKESSYFNFSGGERKRIDLAILFMFQDVLKTQSSTFFSLSMYDELFDSALDAKGVNKILEILKDRTQKYDESIYIVSHNKEALNSDINNIILLEKYKGQTNLIS